MATTTKPKGKRALFLDISDNRTRGRKHSDRMAALSALEVGSEVVLDHTGYRTQFPVWIAQARMRLDKKFSYEAVPGDDHRYKVTCLPGESVAD